MAAELQFPRYLNALKHEGDKKAAESALALVKRELESHTKASRILQAEYDRLKEDNNIVM